MLAAPGQNPGNEENPGDEHSEISLHSPVLNPPSFVHEVNDGANVGDFDVGRNVDGAIVDGTGVGFNVVGAIVGGAVVGVKVGGTVVGASVGFTEVGVNVGDEVVAGAAVIEGTQHLIAELPGHKPLKVVPLQTALSRHLPKIPGEGVQAWAGTQHTVPPVHTPEVYPYALVPEHDETH